MVSVHHSFPQLGTDHHGSGTHHAPMQIGHTTTSAASRHIGGAEVKLKVCCPMMIGQPQAASIRSCQPKSSKLPPSKAAAGV